MIDRLRRVGRAGLHLDALVLEHVRRPERHHERPRLHELQPEAGAAEHSRL
jgi:hypothetical protein